MDIDRVFLKILEEEKIDILTFRYYTRLISLAENAISSGERKMSLEPIGEDLIKHVVLKRQS